MKKFVLGLIAVALLGCSKDKPLTVEEQHKKDVDIIDKYIADNNLTAISDPSGVRIVITAPSSIPGGGVKPVIGSTITVKYTGKFLTDGSIFETSGNKTITAILSTAYLIQGWVAGFPYIEKGSKASLYIPSGLAYGPNGNDKIPGNANLIFDVELVEVK